MNLFRFHFSPELLKQSSGRLSLWLTGDPLNMETSVSSACLFLVYLIKSG